MKSCRSLLKGLGKQQGMFQVFQVLEEKINIFLVKKQDLLNLTVLFIV